MLEVQNCAFDRSEPFDLVVISGGYESRSVYIARLEIAGQRRLAVRLPRVEGACYDSNWSYLRESGWEAVVPDTLESELRQTLERASSGLPARIAIDISSMPRTILGKILEIFNEHGAGAQVTFLYCPAWFETSAKQAQLDVSLSAQPVSSYFAGAVRPSHVPIGLVVGLGLEPHRSDGVREFLEPGRLWAFVAQGLDERFVSSVLEVNEYFLRGSGVEVLRYDIRDIAGTVRAIGSMNRSAGHHYRVVLAPSGPKVFTLACLLVGLDRAIERPAVWRVGPTADPIVAVDVEGTGEVVSCRVRFLGRSPDPEPL